MNFFFTILFFSISFICFSQVQSWQTFTDSIPTLSSPRACDLNNDGIKDIVIGGGTDGVASNSGIMAFNGSDGSLLWKLGSRNEVFGSAIFQDITNDGIKDVFITGRQAQLLAINGANGQLIWDYFPFAINPADSGLFNFYNPQFINDVSGDGLLDILVSNGGDHAAPDWVTERPPGHLMVINAQTGELISKAVVPDSAETYCSPIVANIQGNGIPWVLYGTGGENLGGSFWACPLDDLIQNNSLLNSVPLASDSTKGFIAPASLHKLANGSYDIIIQGFGGKLTKIKGFNFSLAWQYQLENTESSAQPVLGNFIGGDNIPDVLAILFKGVAPSYSDFYQVLIDGNSGQLLFKDSMGVFNYASANALDFDNNGRDEGLVSITYQESGVYKHRLQKINFISGNIEQIGSTQAGVNLGSTPLITDLDGDLQIDIVYAVKKDSLNPVGWKGIYVNRQELLNIIPNTGIAWGSYLGTENDGIYNLDVVNCGTGSVISSASISQISCNGIDNGSISLAVTPGSSPNTFLWTTGESESTIDSLGVGTYSVMVTNAQGCFETRTFNINNPYTISFGGIASPTCPNDTNGMATVNSSGCPCQFSTCTFLWDNGITIKPNNSLTSGWHSIVINHPDGCVVTDSVFVPEATPVITDTIVFYNTCYGEHSGSIELFDSNYQPVVYNWSNGESASLVDSLSAGSYNVVVSDVRGCADSLNFIITEPLELILTTQINNVLCNGDATGEIVLLGQGGTGNYTYWVDNQLSSPALNSLVAGNYLVSVSDENNCFSENITVSVNEPLPISLVLSSSPQILALDGTASATVSGGTPPYTYQWSDINSQSESLAVYLNSGWYTVVVTDANGCEKLDSVFVDFEAGINNPFKNPLTIYPNPGETIVYLSEMVNDIILTDGSGRVVLQLNNVSTIDITDLSSGTYLITGKINESTLHQSFIKK